MAPGSRWDVLSGDKNQGGILVRVARDSSSAVLRETLAPGARLEEIELVGDRLHYRLVSGEGPERGWLTVRVQGQPLLTPAAATTISSSVSATSSQSVSAATEPGAVGVSALLPGFPRPLAPAASASPPLNSGIEEASRAQERESRLETPVGQPVTPAPANYVPGATPPVQSRETPHASVAEVEALRDRVVFYANALAAHEAASVRDIRAVIEARDQAFGVAEASIHSVRHQQDTTEAASAHIRRELQHMRRQRDAAEVRAQASVENERQLRAELTEALSRAAQEAAACLSSTRRAEVAEVTLSATRSELQRCRAALPSNTAGGAPPYVWHYQQGRKWHAFNEDATEKIHAAYRAHLNNGHEQVEVTSGDARLHIDFVKMVQSVEGGPERRIRLTMEVPRGWTFDVPQLLLQDGTHRSVLVPVQSEELLKAMEQLLRRSSHGQAAELSASPCCAMGSARVRSVSRVENYNLWRSYESRLLEIMVHQGGPTDWERFGTTSRDLVPPVRKLLKGEDLNFDAQECMAFYGTSAKKALQIAACGFDLPTTRRPYALGTYLTTQACMSHQIAVHASPDDYALIVVRVALGRPHVTREVLAHADGRFREPPEGHDSLIACPRGHQDHQELVVFDNAQVLPCYIVRYVL